MDAQLRLLRVDPKPSGRHDPQRAWRLDDETIRAGKRGVAMARAALHTSRHDRHDHRDDDDQHGRGRRADGAVRGHAA